MRWIGCVIIALVSTTVLANSWTNRNSDGPGEKDGHMMAYDAESDRVILFGDHSTMMTGRETWAYHYPTNTWTQMSPSSSPPNLVHGGMVYDGESDVIIQYGGQQSGSRSAATWVYDYNRDTWTNMNPSPNPGPKIWHGLAYDSQSDRVILYGGEWLEDETWAYDYNTNTWTNMNPTTQPPGMHLLAMAHDSDQDRVVAVFRGETWAYDYDSNSWQWRNSGGPPEIGSAHPQMVYDSQSRRMIYYNDDEITWAYDYAANSWTNMSPGTSPFVHHHAMTYVPPHDRIVLYGGRGTGSAPPTETWEYELGGGTPQDPPAPPTGLSVN